MKDFNIFNIEISSKNIYLYVISTKNISICPLCNKTSKRIHSRYYRTLKDLPILGYPLEIIMICRKFFCDNPCCHRKVFTERFPDFIKPYSRRTDRLDNYLRFFAFSTSSNAMANILKKIPMSVSKNTLIRILRNTDIQVNCDVKYIGVDDFAFKKGNNYGTLICDLISHKPIDLLPDRKSKTFEKWLIQHPQVEIVSRDRSGAYAKGIKDAHKEIIQIADRFHIFHNLLEGVKNFLKRTISSKLIIKLQGEVSRKEINEITEKNSNTQITKADKEKVERHNKKKELIREVKTLHSQGDSVWEISRITKLSRKTIKKYIEEDEEKIVIYTRPQKLSIINEYKDFIKECINNNMKATEILEKLKLKGYSGSYGTITNYIRKFKKEEGVLSTNNTSKNKTISRYNIANYMWKNNDELEEYQLKDLKLVFNSKPIIEKIYRYIQSFRSIFKTKDLEKFKIWVKEASESDIKELERFSNGIIKDFDAVMNSFKYDYNNGLLEGQINRLKMIKRQMYGRAKFDLLKKRILYVD
ncbi:ISL3 family transposase [Inediibacterium massiliense]|uniref:ISL3 family transposase n=1 Tax=Inediibacterium massiliense TaxID=1658111 RepID=UPI0018FE427E|nr:ISL3 family transposase [Inediibacterium massiliense]